MANKSFNVKWNLVKDLAEIVCNVPSTSTIVGCFQGKWYKAVLRLCC